MPPLSTVYHDVTSKRAHSVPLSAIQSSIVSHSIRVYSAYHTIRSPPTILLFAPSLSQSRSPNPYLVYHPSSFSPYFYSYPTHSPAHDPASTYARVYAHVYAHSLTYCSFAYAIFEPVLDLTYQEYLKE